MIESTLMWLVGSIGSLGYLGLIILMAIESTFVPLPSEIILPPAGYLVYTGEMNMILVIACGTFGSILGASLNYWIGMKFGRKFILKLGKYVHLSEERYNRTESFFLNHGEVSTFVGRLLVGVRHFISFPAGVAKMNFGRFVLWTALGAAIWSTVLTVLGFYVGKEQELLHQYYREIGIGLVVFCILIIGGYIWWHKRKKEKK